MILSKLRENWIYESIVTTYGDGIPNSAPMGIKRVNENIILDIYKKSNTCGNILKNSEFVINFTSNIRAFYDSIFEKNRIEYEKSKIVNAPILKDSDAYLEMRVIKLIDRGEKIRFVSEVVNSEMRGDLNLINRARFLSLESIIIFTKIPHLPGDREFLLKLLERNYNAVCGVAPGSIYEKISKELFEKLNELNELNGINQP
ncbi:MAG: hypothetical protein DRO90_02050 [Candidatus Altiarchaeales archaeon]|nr:MAG: hypothetical protein DRO90_02050 [Candidatus Altiarchaeales archaeon]